jgi:hypothetical protein
LKVERSHVVFIRLKVEEAVLGGASEQHCATAAGHWATSRSL